MLNGNNGSDPDRQVEAPLEFQRWLAWRMGCLGLTAPALAEAVGVVDATVYNWLSGLNRPYRQRFPQLIEVLQVTPEIFTAQLGLTMPQAVIPRRWAKLIDRARDAGPEAEKMVLTVANTMLDHWE
jgi:transcriptional regulator with XRE-family HTH domain